MWEKMYKPMDLLQKGLSASWQRNAVIRHNIANVETPGFKASVLEFESLFAKALREDVGFVGTRTHEGHRFLGTHTDIMTLQPSVTQSRTLSMRMDGNNVDIENENVRLAQNSIYYNTLMEKMNSEIRRLRLAISEGR